MSMTPEQLEKIAFMNTSREQYCTNKKSDERFQTVVASFQKAKKQSRGKSIYTCRRCSCVLFHDTDLVDHNTESLPHVIQFQQKEVESPICSSLFLEQVPWCQDLSNDEGKLTCPKCNCRVGSYTWYGERCSCGQWLTPSLKISKRKVDLKSEK